MIISSAIKISNDFFKKNSVVLSFNDLLFLFDEGIIEPKTIVEYAFYVFSEKKNENIAIVELASLFENEYYKIKNILEANLLYQSDEVQINLNKKIMYLLLLWFYQNKNSIKDISEMIDLLYSDFDYPEEISHLISYMPIDENEEYGLNGMMNRLKVYLSQNQSLIT